MHQFCSNSFARWTGGQRRFLVQSNFGTHYAYGVLEIRNGEGLLKSMVCAKIDRKAFGAAGGTVVTREGSPDSECQLDSASKPLDLLKSVAAHASGFEQRYVPARVEVAKRIAKESGDVLESWTEGSVDQKRLVNHNGSVMLMEIGDALEDVSQIKISITFRAKKCARLWRQERCFSAAASHWKLVLSRAPHAFTNLAVDRLSTA
jgi:hypothetical protein